jgi:hypothetical protein
VPVVMVEEEPDLAGSLATYLAGLDGQRTGKLIHDLRTHVETLAKQSGEDSAPVGGESGEEPPAEDTGGLSEMEADAAAEADDLAAGAPY